MTVRSLVDPAEVAVKVKHKANKSKLKDAVDKIATVCSLTNPEKKALKHALTSEET